MRRWELSNRRRAALALARPWVRLFGMLMMKLSLMMTIDAVERRITNERTEIYC
jgi:hypothetical protein